MSETVRAAFREQARACAALGSPFTAWLCESLAGELTPETRVGARVLGWRGEPSGAGDSVALRLCGALHALAISGTSPELAGFYTDPRPDEDGWAAVLAALEEHDDFVLAFLDSPPQTNEVARAAAIHPGLSEIARRTSLPLALLEVGASAGLNLNCDRFGYRLDGRMAGDPGSPLQLAPRWTGGPPPAVTPEIVARRGCDLRPIRLDDRHERIRLFAYVWADQAERLARLEAAVEIAAHHPVTVDAEDALTWLEACLAEPQGSCARVIYSTVAWQYLPPEARAEGERLIEAAGARAGANGPLAWLRVEADGETPGAAITLRMWSPAARGDGESGATETLGRADFHGRWVDWR